MRRKLLVVCAVLMLTLLPMSVSASDQMGDFNTDMQFSLNADATLQLMAYANLACEHFSVDVDVNVAANDDLLTVGGLVEAVAKNDQYPEKNMTFNYESDNNATVAGSSMTNFTGNLGVNVAAGNSNAQSNIATYAAGEADASLTRAVIFSVQKAMNNLTKNEGSANNAAVASDVLNGATGNVGLNVAAGSNNAQTNMTSIATAPAKVGMALAYVQQKSLENMTCNGPTFKPEVINAEVNLSLSGTVNFPDTPFTIYQADNFYLDTWDGPQTDPLHPASNFTGHIDMDGDIDNAVMNPWDSSVGGIAFETVIPDAQLSGTVSGTTPVVISVLNKATVNNAAISANTLSNLTGNFGINVAAGSNNLQANAFAACYVPSVNGGGETPIPGE
ncbi:MAG TPA: hypothetical protein PK425_07750 [Syntrophales bacterium]|nr:hypothetical protein [Syntrophales bacterium]HPX56415.1 hypothetical protein [Syntrophales bacterium]HQA82360.1 hypothetical protein [Syntrophales bacterium]